ncbi:hypothetical protein BC939DRAFT_475688 [Gamsiella multidivaricata]|uniref:uncharacterized protein n=1 Tax=Gamsiella multidivaricata TaxID=101098 RepID=UPI0022207D51|nr:uncharacterized protein BC939DRAFT_475688 [Gamsiella multidivaricata]KAI7826474.1 hypothetical protein BC939DRAFT_475688 [Gamsiella multidivaricata]
MHHKRPIAFLCLCFLYLLPLASVSQAHVGLLRPCSRGSPRAGCPPVSNGQYIDYDLNSPIGTHDIKNAPLCKQTIASATRTTVQAGQDLKTEYSIGATHGGGHCQWALSYDNGKTWVVLKTLIRRCLQNASASYSVDVPIPKNAPNGKAIFMWLWNNAIGDRELYSNCADITIKGGVNGGSLKGVAPLIANYGNSSLLIPEFGSPGQDDKHEAFAQRKSVTVSVC